MRYETPLVDPRPLAPPDPPFELEPQRYWHLLSDDHDHEDYAYTEDELEQLIQRFCALPVPFTVRSGTYTPD